MESSILKVLMIGKSFLRTCDKGTRTRGRKGTGTRECKGTQGRNSREPTQGNAREQKGNSRELRFPDARVIDDPLHGIINVANQKQKWTDMAKELSVEQLDIVACCLEAMNGPSGQTKFVFINAVGELR